MMIDFESIKVDDDTINFTLSWNEPFANFDPIVNYTVIINCTITLCPVIVNTGVTSVDVNIITDLSVMNLISVTASNSVGASDPTTRAIVGRHPTNTYVHAYVLAYIAIHTRTCTFTYVHNYMYISNH